MSLVRMNPNNSWSLARRLYLSCAAACFFLILATSIFFYATLAISIKKAHEKFLTHKILVIQQILNNEKNNRVQDELDEELNWELGAQQDYYFIRVINLKTNEMNETKRPPPNPKKKKSHFAVSLFPKADPVTHAPSPVIHYKHHGRHYLLISQVILANKQNYLVQVAINVSYENRILFNFRIYLITVVIVGFFLSLLIGKLIAKKGLKPLFNVTQSIQDIDISHLHNRIQLANTPRELAGLIVAFNAMLQRLESGVKRLSQFSADLAHELRTPVNNLTVATEIQLSRARTVSEYQAVLQSNLEEYTKLSRIIDGILFLARTEHESNAIEKQHVNIKNLFLEMQDFFEAQAEEKNITIQINCINNLTIFADPLLIQRAFINLISNAMRYARSKIQLKASVQNENEIIIQIIDDGEGIAAEHLPNVFQRFYRIDYARSRETGGSGLGLAIVQSIMELHSGTVSVESEIGKGTCFTLRFLT